MSKIRDSDKPNDKPQHAISELERALVVLAWEAGDISAGYAFKALSVDIVTGRGEREKLIAEGVKIADRLVESPPPRNFIP